MRLRDIPPGMSADEYRPRQDPVTGAGRAALALLESDHRWPNPVFFHRSNPKAINLPRSSN